MLPDDLPTSVTELIRSAVNCEFATVSAAGVPIDTPMLAFPSEGLESIDIGTGLSYPAKAERARRNPKTGLLFQGGRDEPVVSMACLAAVMDSDLQANTDRYLAETAIFRVDNAPWELARELVTYWTRIIVRNFPVRILWWDSPASLDRQPHVWRAPAGASYPSSDPAPPGAISRPSPWPRHEWRALAERALQRRVAGHLTLLDEEGFPLPFAVREVALERDGFVMAVPEGAPWQRRGKATLTFSGRETFVGEVTADGGATHMRVERALPVHPYMEDPSAKWDAGEAIAGAFMDRLRHETARRGQPIPVIPVSEPEPSPGAQYRMARRRR